MEALEPLEAMEALEDPAMEAWSSGHGSLEIRPLEDPAMEALEASIEASRASIEAILERGDFRERKVDGFMEEKKRGRKEEDEGDGNIPSLTAKLTDFTPQLTAGTKLVNV